MAIKEKPGTHPVHETIKANLARFKKTMSGAANPTDEAGVEAQTLMLNSLRLLFRQEDPEVFNQGMKIFEDFAKAEYKDKGCWAPAARFSYLHLARRIAKNDHSAMMMIINLLCQIQDTAAREQVLGRIDMSRLDRMWPNGGNADKLINYFNQH